MSDCLVPEGWLQGKLGDLAKGIRGVSYKPENLLHPNATDSVALLRSTNIQGGRLALEDMQFVPANIVSKMQFAQPGDIAVCMSNGSKALVGKSAPFDATAEHSKMTVGAFCSLFRPVSGSNDSFVRQVFSGQAFQSQVDLTLAGSAINNLRNGALENFDIAIPPPVEQRSIAEVLSALDEQIEQTEALVAKLMFHRTGLTQECLIPAALAGPTVPLGAVCSLITSGSRGWAKHYAQEGALFLRIGNLTRDNPNMLLEDLVRVQVPKGGEGARTRLEPGDVLISITADLGVIGCIPPDFEEAYVNQHIALARINDVHLNPRWVAHFLGSPLGYDQISKLNDGGAKAGLNLPTIRALKIPKPTPEVQSEIVALLDSVDDEIAMEQALSKKLRLQKQGLMRDLLTGATRIQ
jgi:type I restriction enzyme S subunit